MFGSTTGLSHRGRVSPCIVGGGHPSACVIVFGRQPVPGRAKTRLGTHIGAPRAADVYEVMLHHTVAEAVGSELPVILELAEPPGEDWTPPHDMPWALQAEGDLGVRMRTAFDRCFDAGYERAVLVGSDIPGLNRTHLARSIQLLQNVPVVLGPARDGGYYLVAQRAPGADLFTGIPWSVSDTLALTRLRLLDLSLGYGEVETLSDVDRHADLEAALAEGDLPGELEAALRTAAALE